MINAERDRSLRRAGRREFGTARIVAASVAAIVATIATIGTASAQSAGQTASAVTEQLFNSVNGSVCTIAAIATDGSYVSRGTGFVLKDSGLLVTNAHVVAGLRHATAKCGGRQLDIRRIVKFDPNVDMAIGEIGSANVPGLELATGMEVRPGTQVYAFGSPHGLEGTITPGLASGQRTLDGRAYIQISGPISAGNSGGPITDENGVVVGVAVASLEADHNITFAIPASAIAELPDVDMQTAELAEVRYGGNESGAAEESSHPVRPAVAIGTAAFRGNTFGAPCGDVAIAEFQRKRSTGGGKGEILFDKWYSGTLELDVDLLGTPATVFYDCDDRFGMTSGHYRIRGHADGVQKIASVLRSKYGSGIVQQLSEAEAKQRGCLWNSSLPGSRHYRPSEWQSWRIDDRFRIDLLVCGGRSTMTFLFYSDPALVASVSETESPLPDRPRYRDTDL